MMRVVGAVAIFLKKMLTNKLWRIMGESGKEVTNFLIEQKNLTKHDGKLAASMQSFREIRALGMIGMDKEKMVGLQLFLGD
jgi:hypothetical protein